jgi:hypothetical protein
MRSVSSNLMGAKHKGLLERAEDTVWSVRRIQFGLWVLKTRFVYKILM